jgi:DNA invertase Pin-like site-specific DNA recombinase
MRVEFVKENLTLTGEDAPMATLLLSVMGLRRFERALTGERQREGIAAAKQRGVHTGRKPALTAEQATGSANAPPSARLPTGRQLKPEPIQDPLLCGSPQHRESQARNGQTRAHPEHH